MNVIISACLLGMNCRYDGNGFQTDIYSKLKDKVNLIPVCSEQMGGLTTPRLPVEIKNSMAVNKSGEDCSEQFKKGAEEVLNIAKMYNCKIAILKSNSPSCGFNKIYDGTFSGKLIDGDGITSELLHRNGIKIFNEKNFEKIL